MKLLVEQVMVEQVVGQQVLLVYCQVLQGWLCVCVGSTEVIDVGGAVGWGVDCGACGCGCGGVW